MTQYRCGHPAHRGLGPNLTLQVCSALGGPAVVVGELNSDAAQDAVLDDAAVAAEEESDPDPAEAYTGTPKVDGGVRVPWVVTTTTSQTWPTTTRDWLTLGVALGAVGFFLARIVQPFTETSAFRAWWLWTAALILLAAVSVWARRRHVERLERTSTDWRVVVPCPVVIAGQAHSTVFSGPPEAPSVKYVFGSVASEQDEAIAAGQAKYASADDAVDRLTRQARSIFTGQALFVLLLGGVVWRVTTDDSGVASGIDNIDGFVRNNGTEFSLAIAALATSFAMATLAQTFGFAGGVNLRDQRATAREFNRVLRIRAGLVQNASVMLGVSLLLAVAVPIASALSRTTGIEISSPTWTLTDGEWKGTVEVAFQDLRDDERLELAAVRHHRDDEEFLARWVGVRPASLETGDSLSVPLRFSAAAGPSPVVILARVVQPGQTSDSPTDCPHADAPALSACAEFDVPQPPSQPPTVSAAWTPRTDGRLDLTLTTTGSNLESGQQTRLDVAVYQSLESPETRLESRTIAASTSGALRDSTTVMIDPAVQRFVVVSLAEARCTPTAVVDTSGCALFAVPGP